jgi:cysteinyl-tRNA synthetase
MELELYNSLGKSKQVFTPIQEGHVGLYTCGPTVYNFAHIGNLRTYVFEDILKRALLYSGYTVNHVMNITDVGHLTDDADAGEDKMEKGSKREGKSAWDIALFYQEKFEDDMRALNILTPTTTCKATDHIAEQIALVETLTKKGFTYETEEGIYFDTTKLADYGKLVDLKNQKLEGGQRVSLGEKKDIHDFALWKFTPAGEERQMEWEAFGRHGFPGWHIECSAMAMKYLGKELDIHCGGVDHMPVHHTNEIAQSEAATGKAPWVKYWMHGEFLVIKSGDEESTKMAKSGENFITLSTLTARGIHPLAYRFWLLMGHYRTQMTFTWEALTAGQTAYERFVAGFRELGPVAGAVDETFSKSFREAVQNDLDMPKALSIAWEVLKSDMVPADKRATLIDFDAVLGLRLAEIKKISIPDEDMALAKELDTARFEKNFVRSDEIRKELEAKGYEVKNTPNGTVLVSK